MSLAKSACIVFVVMALAACANRAPRVADRVVLIAPPADLPSSGQAGPAPAPTRAAPPATSSAPAASDAPAADPPAVASPAASTPADPAAATPAPAAGPAPAAPSVAAAPAPPAAPVAASRPAPPPSSSTAPPQPPLAQTLYFEPDAYKIDGRHRAALQAHARRLKGSPAVRMRIEAHTDRRGARDYNLALSKKRAETVAKFLVAQGVAAERLDIAYHGEGPRGGANAARAAAAARRVELRYLPR